MQRWGGVREGEKQTDERSDPALERALTTNAVSVGAFHFQRSSMNHFYFHGCETRRDSDPACLTVGRLAACG